MNIQTVREKDLTPIQAAEILELQHAAFPGTPEFAYQRWWHAQLDERELWFFGREDTAEGGCATTDGCTAGGGCATGRLICSVRVIFRTILAGGREYRVAGIGNVASHPDVRGKGAGKACMQAVGQFIAQSADLDFGLLFTGPPTDGFYAKLGWKTIPNKMSYLDEKDIRHEAQDKGVSMIHAGKLSLEQWPNGVIDLNGRDW